MKTLIRNAAEFVLAMHTFSDFYASQKLIRNGLTEKIIPLINSSKSDLEINKKVSKLKNKSLCLPDLYNFYNFLLNNNTNRIIVGYSTMGKNRCDEEFGDMSFEQYCDSDGFIYKDIFVQLGNEFYKCFDIKTENEFCDNSSYEDKIHKDSFEELTYYEKIFDTKEEAYSDYVNKCIKFGNIELKELQKQINELKKFKKDIAHSSIIHKVDNSNMFAYCENEDLKLFIKD